MNNTNLEQQVFELQQEREQLEGKNQELRRFVEKLYLACIRTLFSLKFIVRIGTLGIYYYWLGTKPTVILFLYILSIKFIQIGINKLKTIIKPDIKDSLREWFFPI